MPKILYTGINREVETQVEEAPLLQISLDHKIPHLHECGGNGRCTTCRVRVIDGHGNLSPPTAAERRACEARRWDPSVRLACQARVRGDVKIQRLVWSSAEVSRLQLETVPEGEAEERSIAILVCDVRDFTRITSRNLAFDMAHMLNRFYTALGDPILMNNGVIYQYVGDEIVGIFGTAGGSPEQIRLDAVRAALGMQYAVERLNRFEFKDFDTTFEVGVGVDFGRAFIGHLGHPKHRQFTIVGDPINVANRIQGHTKEVGARILISEALREGLPEDTITIARTIRTRLPGRDEESELHEVRGFVTLDMNLELQATLDLLLRNEEDFAARFYALLFERAPAVRALFKRDIVAQGRLLTHMLGGIVYALGRTEFLTLGLRTLGRSHERYGVLPEHYPIVREVLLDAIREELGEALTERSERAWTQALAFITTEMAEWRGRDEQAMKDGGMRREAGRA